MEKYTREQMSAAFDKVKDREHWKNPIDAVIEKADMDPDLITEAIIFFTGSVPKFLTPKKKADRDANRIRVKADGYFLTIGA